MCVCVCARARAEQKGKGVRRVCVCVCVGGGAVFKSCRQYLTFIPNGPHDYATVQTLRTPNGTTILSFGSQSKRRRSDKHKVLLGKRPTRGRRSISPPSPLPPRWILRAFFVRLFVTPLFQVQDTTARSFCLLPRFRMLSVVQVRPAPQQKLLPHPQTPITRAVLLRILFLKHRV